MEIYENLSLENLDGEIWKDVEGFPDYQISNLGRVKSFKIYHGTNERILKPRKNVHGYLQVILYKNNKKYTKTIHRLVLENFNPIENMNELECNHIDGNKENNIFPENIEWCSHSENIKYAFRVGLKSNKGKNNPLFGKHPSKETRKKQSERMKGQNHPFYGKHHSEESKRLQSEKRKGKYCGENNPSSKLKEKDIIEIRIFLKEGILTQKEIAKKFGVTQNIISAIKTKKIWRHI